MIACPICGSGNISQVYEGPDRVVPKLFLFKCRACGMIFLGNQGYDLKEIHEAYWKMLKVNLGDDCSVHGRDNQQLFLNSLEKFAKKGRLLEVGSGDGSFLKLAKNAGWEVYGVDVSCEAVNIARQKHGVDCLNGTFEEAYHKLSSGIFDVVVMWGVIEHLKDPMEALKGAKLLLKKGGLLVIFTPNANSIFHRLARAAYSFSRGIIKFPMERLIISMHQMYFTPETLRKLINRCGFSMKEIELSDINLDFIFKAHKNFWWSNKIILYFAKLLQGLSHLNSMHSHMVIFAEAI